MTHSAAPQEVLIVDDCASNLMLYNAVLSRAGYAVRQAKDGPDALTAIEASVPSLLILDYMMPGMNGGEVIRRLRAERKTEQLPIIVLTASVASDDIDTALAYGANDYINKPVDSRILLTRIKSMIQAHADRNAAGAAGERDALRRELDEAQVMQQAQLPQVPASWPGWVAMGGVVPSGQVAGDIFDIFSAPDGRHFTSLIDVSGHGTASALVAAEVRMGLRNLLGQYPLEIAMGVLNNRLADRELGKYACLAVVQTEHDRATIVNAGLPPVLLLRGGETAREVVASGMPTGMFRDAEYDVTVLAVELGDRVVMVSDGLTEPFGRADNTQGAVERLGLKDNPPISFTRLQLESHVRPSGGEAPLDDATLLILERV